MRRSQPRDGRPHVLLRELHAGVLTAGLVPDVIAPNLQVLFVGINPGLASAAAGHHFARPGNRFWKALAGAGFTDRVLAPSEDDRLVEYGLGITNLVDRATAGAAALSKEELVAGGRRVAAKALRYRPACLAFLGITTYRTTFGLRDAVVGSRPERIGGARAWILPNPSGLNAHYQLAALVAAFVDLRAVSGS
jgi:TDG/mug DNA glycosylase family protein